MTMCKTGETFTCETGSCLKERSGRGTSPFEGVLHRDEEALS